MTPYVVLVSTLLLLWQIVHGRSSGGPSVRDNRRDNQGDWDSASDGSSESDGVSFRRPFQRKSVNDNGKGPHDRRDLRRLIEELEESDYGNFGSWGNFRNRQNMKSTPQYQNNENNQPIKSKDQNIQREMDYRIIYDKQQYIEGQYKNEQIDDLYSLEEEERHNISDFVEKDSIEIPYWEKQQSRARSLLNNNENQNHQPVENKVETTGNIQKSVKKINYQSSKNLDPNNFLRFKSVAKLGALVVFVSIMSYASVVPRSLPTLEYNLEYKKILLRVACSGVWPFIVIFSIFRNEDANINHVIHNFVASVFIYYPVLCLVELAAATLSKLLILKINEPDAFKLCPQVPSIYLPWVLTSHGYYPSRLTLMLCTFVTDLIVCPIIEEVYKLIILKFALKRLKAEKINTSKALEIKDQLAAPSQDNAITIRSYLILMTSLTLGLKVADNIRRILCYGAPTQRHKMFFAIARGMFPVQELCSAMIALKIGRRDVLNEKNISIFVMLFPSIFLHIMACIRGVKPMFWASQRPWDEVQLQAWNAADDSAAHKLFISGIMNLLWFMVLIKSLSNIIHQYIVAMHRQKYNKNHVV